MVKILCQNEVVFDIFTKCQFCLQAKKRIFENFFSKCTHSKTNCHRDMKPTSNGHKYPKFSEDKNNFSHISNNFEIFKLKVLGPLRLVGKLSDMSISSSSSLIEQTQCKFLETLALLLIIISALPCKLVNNSLSSPLIKQQITPKCQETIGECCEQKTRQVSAKNREKFT